MNDSSELKEPVAQAETTDSGEPKRLTKRQTSPSMLRSVVANFKAELPEPTDEKPEAPEEQAEIGTRIGRRESQPRSGKGALAPVPPPSEARGRGRPPGKHSDINYTQATAYVREEIHDLVMEALWRNKRKLRKQKRAQRQPGGEEKARKVEYSELVEQLLIGWLKAQGEEVPE